MHVDPASDTEMIMTARRPRRRPWLRLLSEILKLAGGQAEVLRHQERPWASVTFSGSRHTVTLRFAGADGAEAGEAFIAALPEHEFTLADQLVADAAVVAVEQEMLPEPTLELTAELLLIENA